MRLSLVLFFSFLFFTGCGYKPATYYTKKELSGTVFVNLSMNLEDPRNTVLIKDAMNEILVHKLKVHLVDDPNLADTIINLRLNSVGMSLVQENEDGYDKVYRARVSVEVKYENEKGAKSFNVTGASDFTIDSGSTITDTNRFQGIREAASKALEEVVSKLAINSFQSEKTDK